MQCLILWSERNTKAIMSVKDTGSEEFLEFTVCPAYEHAYSDPGLAVSLAHTDSFLELLSVNLLG